MRVVNIHKRKIHQPKEKVSQLFNTLATKDDQIWPYENWPAIKFNNGIQIGSKGGHGRIRYTVIQLIEGEYMKFQFSKPKGFTGIHELKVNAVDSLNTEIIHEIRAKTSFKATILWVLVIRWLHDALIEDAFDKVENYFTNGQKATEHSSWVKLLREVYKRKSFRTKLA
ncbi:hypothetical protein [Winogradskyella sp.]|uniref:hypothetical protein n=1 Tax=Winogradskyella sp. TaxID=1883156 RepID=UPI00260263F5|nr:hypothetical protein [Winogradskyella sp.]